MKIVTFVLVALLCIELIVLSIVAYQLVKEGNRLKRLLKK